MKPQVARFLQAYAWLMKMYPSRYQREFADERQQAFTQALEEAMQQGCRAPYLLALRELQDYPASVIRANLRELEAIMKTIGTNLQEERFSWIGLLFGMWPFFFLGPLMAIMPYLPRQATNLLRFNSPLWLATGCLSLLIGIILGWRMNFPSWVYPYLVIPYFILLIYLFERLIILLNGLLRLPALSRFDPWVSILILLVAILGSGAAALFLVSRFSSTRKIYTDIRNDWTRLTFGMFTYLAFVTGFYGGDHPPAFGPAVWLPPVIVLLGAVAYLLSRGRRMHSIVLIVTLGMSILGRAAFPTDETWDISAIGIILILILFSPALVGLSPRTRRPQKI